MGFENILLSRDEEVTIRNKSPEKMPLNPTAQGWSGQEVRRYLARSTLDEEGSILSVLKQKLSYINESFVNLNALVNTGGGGTGTGVALPFVGITRPNPEYYKVWIDTNQALVEMMPYDGVVEEEGTLFTLYDPTPNEIVDTDGVYTPYNPLTDPLVPDSELYELESTSYDSNGNYKG